MLEWVLCGMLVSSWLLMLCLYEGWRLLVVWMLVIFGLVFG